MDLPMIVRSLRLRPWWGMSPWLLGVRSIVQAAVAVVVFNLARGLSQQDHAFAGLGLAADQQDKLALTGRVVTVTAVVGVLYSLVRIAVAVLDVMGRRAVSGTVLSVMERRRGDGLPWVVQLLWSRRRDPAGGRLDDHRKVTVEMTVQTDDGVRTWSIGRANRRGVHPGQQVRLNVTPLLGHVSRLRVVDANG